MSVKTGVWIMWAVVGLVVGLSATTIWHSMLILVSVACLVILERWAERGRTIGEFKDALTNLRDESLAILNAQNEHIAKLEGRADK